MANSDHRTARRVERNRLVYYMRETDPRFWDDHWQAGGLSRKDFARALEGDLWHFEKPFLKYLPRDKPVLEAGCGPGKLVLALHVRGYSVDGVEWAPDTVEAVSRMFPHLRINAGDVLNLNAPDNYYGAYISLGVMEHRQDGPMPFLREAFRVLAPDGVALISVPYFNVLRSIKARMGLYSNKNDGATFYQYAFTPAEFEAFLREAGFRVEEKFGYGSYKSMVDELSLLRRSVQFRSARLALKRLSRTKAAERYFSHMMLYICRSKKTS